MAIHNDIGRMGEDIAERFLVDRGFKIVGRNYRIRAGEIDIIASNAGIIHFVEVKSVTRETVNSDISRVTDRHRPEDNVHPQKLKRMHRAIENYIADGVDTDWVIDVVTVEIDRNAKTAVCRILENIT